MHGVAVEPRDDTKQARALWGMSRTMVQNIFSGVTNGFEEKLEINGVGYRAQVQGQTLGLALGYSHDVNYADPGGHQDRDAEADRDRRSPASTSRRSGQVAAEIRRWRPPEPYKGKGVKYADEHIFRKEGKKK